MTLACAEHLHWRVARIARKARAFDTRDESREPQSVRNPVAGTRQPPKRGRVRKRRGRRFFNTLQSNQENDVIRKLMAEMLGTFWLVLGGCGSAVLAGGSIGNLGVALAFGLTVVTGAYAFGRISGGHFNPAVSLGLYAGGRFPLRNLLPYTVSQVLGGAAAAALLYLVCTDAPVFPIDPAAAGTFASNGYGAFSPEGYGVFAAFTVEMVLTAIFVAVIMGATDRTAVEGTAPVAIGLCLTLIHLISIPVTNTSVNPARSTAMALFAGDAALSQLWLFWCAPLLGAVIGGLFYRVMLGRQRSP